jgi:hypothetical protein
MPSLVQMPRMPGADQEKPIPDLMAEFEKAKQAPQSEIPDLLAEFEKVAGKADHNEKETGSSRSLRDEFSQRPSKDNDREHKR